MKIYNLSRLLVMVTRLTQRTGDRVAKAASKKKRVFYKGEVDLVTQFDCISQDLIVKGLKEVYPDFGILSEENIAKNIDRPVKWIVDPLDGTTNFAHGLPIWTLSIALEMYGEIMLGVVYDPTRKEMFSATKNCGAFLNKRRIVVSTTKRLSQSLLVTGFPYDVRRSPDNNLIHFNSFAVRAQAVRRLGSAALDLCYTACGRFDGYWEMKLSPWDQAAGSLILKEAGGKVTDFKGKPFNIYGNEVLGTNQLIHSQMMRILERYRVHRSH